MVLPYRGSNRKDRSTWVMINNVMSQQHILNNSVPQGSIVPGPQGFIVYTHPVGDIIRAHNICFHTYADDTQLFCDFNPKIPGDCERALGVLIMRVRNKHLDVSEYVAVESGKN